MMTAFRPSPWYPAGEGAQRGSWLWGSSSEWGLGATDTVFCPRPPKFLLLHSLLRPLSRRGAGAFFKKQTLCLCKRLNWQQSNRCRIPRVLSWVELDLWGACLPHHSLSTKPTFSRLKKGSESWEKVWPVSPKPSPPPSCYLHGRGPACRAQPPPGRPSAPARPTGRSATAVHRGPPRPCGQCRIGRGSCRPPAGLWGGHLGAFALRKRNSGQSFPAIWAHFVIRRQEINRH